jgi:hypothetical protein
MLAEAALNVDGTSDGEPRTSHHQQPAGLQLRPLQPALCILTAMQRTAPSQAGTPPRRHTTCRHPSQSHPVNTHQLHAQPVDQRPLELLVQYERLHGLHEGAGQAGDARGLELRLVQGLQGVVGWASRWRWGGAVVVVVLDTEQPDMQAHRYTGRGAGTHTPPAGTHTPPRTCPACQQAHAGTLRPRHHPAMQTFSNQASSRRAHHHTVMMHTDPSTGHTHLGVQLAGLRQRCRVVLVVD